MLMGSGTGGKAWAGYTVSENGQHRGGIFFYRLSSTEMCRKHNVLPTAFQDWKDMFLQGGKQARADYGYATPELWTCGDPRPTNEYQIAMLI